MRRLRSSTRARVLRRLSACRFLFHLRKRHSPATPINTKPATKQMIPPTTYPTLWTLTAVPQNEQQPLGDRLFFLLPQFGFGDGDGNFGFGHRLPDLELHAFGHFAAVADKLLQPQNHELGPFVRRRVVAQFGNFEFFAHGYTSSSVLRHLQ